MIPITLLQLLYIFPEPHSAAAESKGEKIRKRDQSRILYIKSLIGILTIFLREMICMRLSSLGGSSSIINIAFGIPTVYSLRSAFIGLFNGSGLETVSLIIKKKDTNKDPKHSKYIQSASSLQRY